VLTRRNRIHRSSLQIAAVLWLTGNTAAWAQDIDTKTGAARVIEVWQDGLRALAASIDEIAAAVGQASQHFSRMFLLLTDQQGWPALLRAIAVLGVLVAIAGLVEYAVARALRPTLRALGAEAALGLLARLRAIAVETISGLLLLILFFALANLGSLVFFERFDPLREFIVTALIVVATTRLAAIAATALFGPGHANQRLCNFPEPIAELVFLWVVIAAAVGAVAYFGGGLFSLLGAPDPFVQAWQLLLGLIAAAWLAFGVWTAPDAQGQARSAWRGGAIGWVLFIWLAWSVNLALARGDGAAAALLAGFAIALVPVVSALAGPLAAPVPQSLALRRLQALAELLRGAVRIGLMVVATGAILQAFGFPVARLLASPDGRRILGILFDVAIASVIGYLTWEASKILIERHVGPELRPGEELKPGSRVRTLLPILRNFLTIVLLVIVGLIVLSSLGVDIAPLLAGAGVVGLAIGFGAQTLVRDIVSGFFFLLDDAFRIGEYVDLGRVKGTVERITIRSLQLRHHRGALHTVPYGQIDAISNYHRDWVIEKLEFGLVYGTDPELVRKVVKKIGLEMLHDPEVAPFILEPLKSQGVKAFGDSSVVFRVKFKAVPGEQFAVRRKAYQMMQEAFKAADIKFAFPTVTIAGTGPSETAMAAVRVRPPSASA
jgi:moderate conductance mechanosensitive channel